MVDTVTAAPMANASDEWEVAADSGEFDKRIERQDKARTPDQVNSACSAHESVVRVSGG